MAEVVKTKKNLQSDMEGKERAVLIKKFDINNFFNWLRHFNCFCFLCGPSYKGSMIVKYSPRVVEIKAVVLLG